MIMTSTLCVICVHRVRASIDVHEDFERALGTMRDFFSRLTANPPGGAPPQPPAAGPGTAPVQAMPSPPKAGLLLPSEPGRDVVVLSVCLQP